MSSARQLDLTGGESIYCINTFQIEKAQEMFAGEGESSDRLRDTIAKLDTNLTRNEQAAIAMLLLQKLNGGPIE